MNGRIEDILTDAANIVESIEITADYRTIAFSKAVDMLAYGQAQIAKLATLTGGSTHPTSDWMNALGNAVGRTAEDLEELFFADDEDTPLLSVDPGRLGENTAQCSRNVILLLVGVRQVSGIETATASEILREECKRLGIFDTSNFGKTLSGQRDWFSFTGSGASKVVRLKPSGRRAFRQLVEDLLSNGDG